MRRRHFLAGMASAPSLTSLPSFARMSGERGKLKITAVEIWRLEGRREAVTGGPPRQQVNPIHIYDEYRPRPHRGSRETKTITVPVNAYYLKIKTDAGLDGIYGPVDKEAAVVVDQQLRTFLTGKDPLPVEALWDQMYRSNRHSRRGHFMMGMSAVDNALWDLRGRYFNAPVYRLLGGPTRPFVEPYGSCNGFSLEPEAVRKRSVEVQNSGIRYQKWFFAYGPGDGMEGMRKNLELVRNLRDALGDDAELMFDAFMGWDLQYAIMWAKQAERYRPHWIEEAFSPDKIESFVELRRATSIPVASGEHFYNRWEVHDFLRAGALHVVQADPEWCGGVSELVKICTLASAHDVRVIPHGHALHAALHVVASQSPLTCPLVEYLFAKIDFYWHHFEKYPVRQQNGKIALPERPGFGIELDESKIEKQERVSWS